MFCASIKILPLMSISKSPTVRIVGPKIPSLFFLPSFVLFFLNNNNFEWEGVLLPSGLYKEFPKKCEKIRVV